MAFLAMRAAILAKLLVEEGIVGLADPASGEGYEELKRSGIPLDNSIFGTPARLEN